MKASQLNPWVMRHRANPDAALRLFCFPYAGGGAQVFRGWAESLPAAVEVYSVQLPGRGPRLAETPYRHMAPLVRAAGEALAPYLEGRFAFFGHSMGARVSFELARELRRQFGREPAQLFVSGGIAPQLPDPRPLYGLSRADFLEELRRLDGMPGEVWESEELLRLVYPTLRADCEVVGNYTYVSEPPLDCPITAFGGLWDNLVTRQQLAGWRDQTRGAFSLRMLPGGHLFLQTAQDMLLGTLSQELHGLARQTGEKPR